MTKASHLEFARHKEALQQAARKLQEASGHFHRTFTPVEGSAAEEAAITASLEAMGEAHAEYLELLGGSRVTKDELLEEVRAIQVAMVEAGGSSFVETQFEYLRCVIRLTVEFYYLLQSADVASLDPNGLTYVGNSIFSGVRSFILMTSACSGSGIPTKSAIDWGLTSSLSSLTEQFISKYQEFSIETEFEKRCGLLLDLFRMQIVFTGMSYE
jgi:hypothetical protein